MTDIEIDSALTLMEDIAYSLTPVIKLLSKDRRAIRISSLAGSSAAFLAANIMSRLGRPVFVMCADDALAKKISEEIEFYLAAVDAKGSARYLPGRDLLRSLPAMGPEIRTAALAAMTASTPEAPAGIAASVQAALLRTTPPDVFADHLFELARGNALDRDAFIAALIHSGCSAVSAVMEPGDFSVRGGIIDVFAPGLSEPLRIELFGDEIESMRSFDPDNQKSTAVVTRAVIPPLKEVVADPESSARAAVFISDLMESFKEERMPDLEEHSLIKSFGEILGRIEREDHFPGIESMLPAFYEERACALDYAGPGWVVIYQEPFECGQAFARDFAGLDRGFRDELLAGRFALPAAMHLVGRREAEAALADCALVSAGLIPDSVFNEEVAAPSPGALGDECSGISGDLSVLRVRPGSEEPLAPFVEALTDFAEMGVKTMVVSQPAGKAHRLQELLSAHGRDLPVVPDARGVIESGPPMLITVGALRRGFMDLAGRLAVIPESEIFGEKKRPPPRARVAGSFLSDLSDLEEGDYVVHVEHGVGVYRGLKSLSVQWVGEWDFVRERERPRIRVDSAHLEYAGGAMLYVPVTRINQISKYAGPAETAPPLDVLGGASWERLKHRVKRSIREFAEYLIRIQAARRVQRRTPFPAPDPVFREFEEGFEYEETPDQLRAIEDVLESMGGDDSMDRVVCGDVGYGKTEVALRAAFLAAMSGRQVALLVPTTILAQQHFETFRKRLAKQPLEVRVISRFLSTREQKEVLAGIERGTADIVIGTHRLLSKDVKFKDLGLLVIDEEHRFGVRHKEKLRELRATVDTLTLTATPIPRTLYMALSGLRDLSIIDTPPPGRLAVHTELVRSDDRVIEEAVSRELRRGGQVFFVHNRVQTIDAAAAWVARLAPSARIATAHGQMAEKDLERVMHDFVARRYDVLACTAIIESGLDIPSANTMIIDRADQFGLAQLYQLRGRIGRSRERGYCYLVIPAKGILTREAAQRLRVLKEFTELGSGFRVAAHDLEIRGAGNVLGAEQSGHISRIGLELYMRMLDDEIKRLRGEAVEAELEPEIKLPVSAYIPDDYMPDQNQRISWYKRLSRAKTRAELDGLAEEMADRYGPLPDPAKNLIAVTSIKIVMIGMRARELAFTGTEIALALAQDTRADVDRVIELAVRDPKTWRITPDQRVFKKFSPKNPEDIFPEVRGLLNQLGAGDKIHE